MDEQKKFDKPGASRHTGFKITWEGKMNNEMILSQNQGFNVSGKYVPVTTQNLINTLIAQGYTQTSMVKTRVRVNSKEGFQKHMVRLAHNDLKLLNVNDSRPEIVIVNSYDGMSSLKVMLGIFRLICSNGMIVGSTFAGFRIRHVGDIHEDIDNALVRIAGKLPEISEKINQYSGLILNSTQQQDFVNEAAKIVLPENAINVNLWSVDRVRRMADKGASLWHTFNRVQEAALRGGIKYQVDKDIMHNGLLVGTQRVNNTTRAIKSIDRQVEVNQALWDLTEKFAA